MDNAEHIHSKSIFISKNEEELTLLPTWCSENGWQLVAHSFLSFEKIDFQLIKSFHVVFFASPRAAQFFLDACEHLNNFQIAVAGDSTKRYVESRGYEVHFCPTNGGDVTESAQLFAQWVGQRFVFFPTSSRSQKSYTRFLDVSQYEIQVIYKTHISTKKVENFDVYVFTSPSNVIGFLSQNTFPATSKLIAWGETTAHTIKQQFPSASIITMHQSSEEELLQLVD